MIHYYPEHFSIKLLTYHQIKIIRLQFRYQISQIPSGSQSILMCLVGPGLHPTPDTPISKLIMYTE